MKKLLLTSAFALVFAFVGQQVSAQNFQAARQEYINQTGSDLYEGQPVQPEWFRKHYVYYDLNGDGIIDHFAIVNEFWLFGYRIWEGGLGEIRPISEKDD